MMIFPDLNTLCRLCFKNTGENDVTAAPSLYETIKDYYNVEVGAIKCTVYSRHKLTFFFARFIYVRLLRGFHKNSQNDCIVELWFGAIVYTVAGSCWMNR